LKTNTLDLALLAGFGTNRAETGAVRAPPDEPVISSRVMNLSRRFALLAALATPALLLAQGEKVTALDRYVKAPDPSYT
jgi:hypothetical protein